MRTYKDKLIMQKIFLLISLWLMALQGADNFYISFNNKNLQKGIPPVVSNQPLNIQTSPQNTFMPTAQSLVWSSLNYKAIKLLLAVYGITFGYLLYDVRTLYNKNSWSLWKEEVPLSTLKALPEKQLYQELIQSIRIFYNKPLLSSLVAFFNDTSCELKKLNRFITLHTWLARLYLNHFFPQQRVELEQARLALKRIEYLREILINNFDQSTIQNLVDA